MGTSTHRPVMELSLPAILSAIYLTSLVSVASPVGDTPSLDNNYHNTLQSALADFSQSLYVQLAETSEDENFVFSPLSLHSALSLLYLGTRDSLLSLIIRSWCPHSLDLTFLVWILLELILSRK